ncbi:hypothetical protein TOPH_07053 [Tolypocladium ophioglossoides CBS 100239]|uniref:4Fe-4S ferredoxin-type domain-containing protein n=1 Tax=Tolypocladium ophioglossoides (strain CBS 100239) TaxID=1163406 RepID=A0A0L0N299_TOLOC|nr:hypothetical protein TOPH_07053 [Tolypocladium ophioglossoides CBS 100239]
MTSLLSRLFKPYQGYSRLPEDSPESKHCLTGHSEKPCRPAPSTGHRRLQHEGGLSSLERLAAELVLEIAAHMSPADQASLALVSRTGLRKLGRASLQLQGASRLDFLVRLERDGARPADALCPQCRVLHPPHLSLPPAWYSDYGAAIRPCAQSSSAGSAALLKKSQIASAFLPLQLHFNMVAGVMRCHRHGWSTYSAETLSSSSRYKYFDKSRYPKLVSTTQCRIVNGHLVAKTEKLIFLCKGSAGLQDAASKVVQLLEREWALRHCCGHQRWAQRYYSTLLSCRDRIWSSRPISEALSFLHLDRHRVKGCGLCYTDCALSAYDLPDDRGRVITLTTWKDLGSGYSINDRR